MAPSSACPCQPGALPSPCPLPAAVTPQLPELGSASAHGCLFSRQSPVSHHRSCLGVADKPEGGEAVVGSGWVQPCWAHSPGFIPTDTRGLSRAAGLLCALPEALGVEAGPWPCTCGNALPVPEKRVPGEQ